MEHIKTFFNTSTIHGLSWISQTRKFSRLFWTVVVIGGFTFAFVLINESFYNWQQSPISTTIKTLPISKIKFPNVTICPPRDLFLNLNWDLMQSKKVKLDKMIRKELYDFAYDVVQNNHFDEMMRNLSKVDYPDRYQDWYYGISYIEYPYPDYELDNLRYSISTYATKGNISTQFFGEKYDGEKVEGNIYIEIFIIIPLSVQEDNETTLMLNIEKKTMKNYFDEMTFNSFRFYEIDADLTQWSLNITGPFNTEYKIKLHRHVSEKEIKNMDLDEMPGFRLTWNYDLPEEPKMMVNDVMDATTQGFVR